MKRQVRLMISIAYFAARSAGNAVGRLFGRKPRRPFVVLCYHAVPSHKKEGFEQQMAEVASYAKVVGATDEIVTGDQPCVAITFDDAFQSVRDNALEVLSRHRFTCTIFAPTGVLGRSPDWEFNTLLEDKQEVIMTMNELGALEHQGVTVGSHSVTHQHLSRLEDHDLERELADSKRLLESRLGRPASTIAFPYGDHDERVVEACRRAGYQAAFSITPSSAIPAESGFVRGRVTVEPDDPLLEFRLKIRGAYAWSAAVSDLKRKLKRGRGQPRIPEPKRS